MSQLNLLADDSNPFADGSVTSLRSPSKASTLSGQDLSAYKVRESKRAKHVSIKVSVEGEVEVVVPPRFERSRLPEILEKRQAWIAKTRARLLRDRAQTVDDWQVQKPDTIAFRWRSSAIDDSANCKVPKDRAYKGGISEKNAQKASEKDSVIETWSVAYESLDSDRTICLPDGPGRITLRGNTDHLPACQAVLRKWLAYRAKKDLAPWLRQVGFDIGLPCRKISVRGQKTCWASCSTRKDISLNFKLLFLPRPLVHYVLVHELCHTVHMNHSKDFWALVGQKQPDYEWRRKAIKDAWRYVPRWVENK